MKRLSVIALLLVAPFAALAQFSVFTDNFNNGSTYNKTSIPGGSPFNSFTSYDVAATKSATNLTTVHTGDLSIALNSGTGSGLLELQALFTTVPVTLVNDGDYICLTYTFRMTNALPTTSAYIAQGFYNSAGVPPVAGALNNSGLGGSGFATGNCQEWQGYYTRILSNAASGVFTRPLQTGGGTTANANQDLLGNNVTGGFASPGPATVGSNETASVALTTGAYYTISYTIAMTDSNAPTLTITNILYSGAGTSGPVLFSITNPATGTTYLTNSFDGIAFGRRDTGGSLVSMDITNITITANIAGTPGQPFDVTGGGLGCLGQAFQVGLDGSVSSNDYYLYTNGVWTGNFLPGTGSALAFTNEPVISVPLTNTVIASNTVNASTGSMLGSVIVAANANPVITNQPIPVVVALNYPSVFSVGVSGGDLSYQWYKNGTALTDVGTISGSKTPTLVISSTAAGDAAPTAQGYYCIITSGCNVTATTATNSLTISSPAGLTWQGNISSNWDLSITANFTNGAANPAVFHNGDNVTFDDTGLAPAVSISSTFIAPTLTTVSSSGTSYSFNGPGTLIGPGALLKNGGSILTINNSNDFSGGTTLTNGGSLVINNLNAVGTGALALGGSSFVFPFSPGSATGFSNAINVTADSTLEYDQKGTYGCVLNGPLMGNSGATLTIDAANVGVPGTARLRLYAASTNSANIVLSSPGGIEIEFAPYQAGGDQIYNGVISGSGGHIVPRGTGSAIFTGANTFSDAISSANNVYSMFISSGNVGIGADSVASTPPTIDSSPVGIGMIGINVGTEGGNCSLFAFGGAHTVANQMQFTGTSNTVQVTFGGTNNLIFTGEFDLSIPGSANDTNSVQRTLQVTNTAATIFAGPIADNAAASGVAGITKTGSGSLYLDGTNTYLGTTTNNAGVLAGTGWIAGNVFINTNGMIGGGDTNIGTLSLSNNLTINGGVFIRVNRSGSPANDVISVSGSLGNNGTGTVNVSNVGSPLVVGDRFQIFNKQVQGGAALTIAGGGVSWVNNLASDGSISVQSIGPSGPTTNASITHVSLSGTNLVILGTNNNVPNTNFHYAVITSTNVALPLSSWTPVVTNPFNADGTFDYTNPIVPGTPHQFIDVLAVP